MRSRLIQRRRPAGLGRAIKGYSVEVALGRVFRRGHEVSSARFLINGHHADHVEVARDQASAQVHFRGDDELPAAASR